MQRAALFAHYRNMFCRFVLFPFTSSPALRKLDVMPVVYPLVIAYFFGLLLCPRLGIGLWAAAACALAGLCCVADAARSRPRLFIFGIVVTSFFSAIFFMRSEQYIFNKNPLRQYLDAPHGEHTDLVRGEVVSSPMLKNGRWRFELRVDRLRSAPGGMIPARGRVQALLPEKAAASMRYGDRIVAEGNFSSLDALDPGVAEAMRRRDISGYFFIHPAIPVKVEKRVSGISLFAVGETLRKRFGSVIERSMRQPRRDVVARMILGSSQDIPREIYDDFRDTGVVHVLVVSGMHVAILMSVFLALAYVWRKNRFITFLVLCPVLLLFYGVTGGGPSVARATVMGFILLLALTSGREYKALPALAWAALLLMVLNPYIVFSVGAQLSFLACQGILLLYPCFTGFIHNPDPEYYKTTDPFLKRLPGIAKTYALRVFLVSLCAQAPLYPVLAYYFHKVSLISPLSNIFVISIVAILMPLGIVMCMLGALWSGFAALLAPVVSGLAALMLWTVHFMAKIPFASVVSGTPSWIDIMLYAMAVACGALAAREFNGNSYTRAMRFFVSSCVAGVVLAWSFLITQKTDELRVTFLDVGQGDAALVEAPCGERGAPLRILIDGGGGPADLKDNAFSAGERIVGDALYARGITALDLVVATHPEEDHLNGLLWIVQNLRVRRVMDLGQDPGTPGYAEFRKIIRNKGISYIQGHSGVGFRGRSCLSVDVLYPPKRMLPLGKIAPNRVSQVIRLGFGEVKILFAGDVESWSEGNLVEQYGKALRADVLKVPHHGSATSSTWRFVRAVSPRVAVISAGRHNMYGHPHGIVLSRYRYVNARILRTDKNGDVTISAPPHGNNLHISTEFH